MPSVWWCNQGQCWSGEREAGAVCSSADAKKITYRETVGDVRSGDIIVHYVKKHIVAISRAREDGRRCLVPPTRTHYYGEGWTFATEYVDLASPIPRDQVNDAIYALSIHGGPIMKNGWVRHAYFMPFSVTGLRVIREASHEEWPAWARL